MSATGPVSRLVRAAEALVRELTPTGNAWVPALPVDMARDRLVAVLRALPADPGEIERAWVERAGVEHELLLQRDIAERAWNRAERAEERVHRAEAVVEAAKEVRARFDNDYEEDEVLDESLIRLFRAVDVLGDEA